MIVLGYFVQKWLGLNKPQSSLSKKAWAKRYGRDGIRAMRKLIEYASELEKEEAQKLKEDLNKFFDSTMSGYQHKEVREMADAVIDNEEQLEEHEVAWLTFGMGNLLLQPEEENTEEDAKRFRQLCVIYEDLQKQKTKLRIKCHGCGRSLKGITQAMIGNIAVCPKCKAEFTIKQKDETSRDKQTE